MTLWVVFFCICAKKVVTLHANLFTMENYIVSARKYRPQTFESVVGQNALTDTLRNAIRQNHLAHAYLFCGPRGVGKTTCARIFAKTINCLNPSPDHEACNVCESCQAFNEQRSYNIHELDAASNNSVEDIRTLIQEVRIPPQVGKYSVYIIDEVHMLSQGAFNALLKTLEEPPSYAIFILATTEKHKVLPTILSRCQVYDFQRITIMDMVHHLQYVASQEGVTAQEEALTIVAQKADGGLRDALSIFDQLVAFCGNHITYERTLEVLNVLDTDYYFRLTQWALAGNVAQALLLFNDVLQHGFDAQQFVIGWEEFLRDVLVSRDPVTVALLETSESIRKQYIELAKQCPAPWLFKALDLANTCDVQYRTAKNRRLVVELFLVKLCQLMTTPSAAPAPAAQPTAASAPAAKPAAAPAPAVKPAPKPATSSAAVPASSATPTPKPAAMPVIDSALPKMPSLKTTAPSPSSSSSSSSSSSLSSTSTSTSPLQGDSEGAHSPFTNDQLMGAWVGLKQHFPQEGRLLAMISSCRPVIKSDNLLQLTVNNPLQKTEFTQFAPQIMALLRDQLHHADLHLELLVAQYDKSSEAYTASERYKRLLSENAHLADFKNQFALQID